MALNAAIDWEVRQDGNDLNGGGFKRTASGVDRTLSASPHATLTAASVVHTTTTQINVAAGDYTVSANDVGNVVQLSGGTATDGFYEITAADTGNNRWTVDRAAGTAGQTCVGRMGGALASLGMASGTPYVAGNLFYVKYSATPYVITGTAVKTAGGPARFDTAGNSSVGRLVVGYDSTRTVSNTDANRPKIDVADSGVTTIVMIKINAGFQGVRNLILDGKSKTSIRGIGGYSREGVENCKVISCTNTGIASSDTGGVSGCEADSCSVGISSRLAVDSWAHDCTSHGFVGGASRCLSTGNGGVGFSIGDGCGARECVAYGNTSHGFNGHYGFAPAANCIAEGNGGWGFFSSYAQQTWISCAAHNNTSGTYSGGTQVNCVTVTDGSVFTNAAGGDFTLNNTASRGALLRGTGFPGTFLNGNVGGVDIGLLQSIPDFPDAGNVTEDDTVNGVAGTYHEATEAEVESGVQFGAGGTEFTGTLVAGGGGGGVPVFGGHVVRR